MESYQEPPPEGPGGLVEFLIAVCHSTELLELFQSSPGAALDRWEGEGKPGLSSSQRQLLEDGNLADIQAAVQAEYPGAQVAIWIGSGPPIHRPIHGPL